ncbi:alcohol dehydrogenase IV [Sanghuangporus baumii]|uniref:Alcohol dehydrogenase IV n=1 Tax=Sanghuangporus baumii TaxID=108892 RepID=A0A9Q5HZK6_SANBA|nr:alcohol dehydrogenase IV [Sanghuangporus baumii]
MDSELHGFYGYLDPLKGVFYGPGCLKDALPKLLQMLEVNKALVVTGKSLHTKTDVVRKVEQVLKSRNAYGDTFWEVGEHAPVAGINAGIDTLRRAGADFIVSVGGGSPIGASKTIIHLVHEEDRNREYLKHIIVSTTLSAAEYSPNSAYTDESGEKSTVSDLGLAPSGVILDAELTVSTPERLWLSTGIRALDHAAENLYRKGVPYPFKVLSYDALSVLFTCLPLSKSHPTDLIIRQKLQIAAWMSRWPLQLETKSATGLSHALGHRLGSKFKIPHGITSCLTLAPVISLQAQFASPEEKKALARSLSYLKIESAGNVEEDVRLLAHAVEHLVAKLGLMTSLEDYGVPSEYLRNIAEGALGEAGIEGSGDPRSESIVEMLEGLYSE